MQVNGEGVTDVLFCVSLFVVFSGMLHLFEVPFQVNGMVNNGIANNIVVIQQEATHHHFVIPYTPGRYFKVGGKFVLRPHAKFCFRSSRLMNRILSRSSGDAFLVARSGCLPL